MKIKVVMPDKAMDRGTLDQREHMLSRALSGNTELSVGCIRTGPDELDCNTDEVFAAPELIKEAIKAEKEGYDAFVIYCFSDVGIDAIRENVSIPVIGPGEVTISVAGMLCNRFVVITTEESNIARTYRRLMKHVVAKEKMAGVKALNVPIEELRINPNATRERLLVVCQEAVSQMGIDGVILGCLGMAQYSEYLEAQLPVKVFDPAFIAIAYAEMSAKIGLKHSDAVYPRFKNVSNVEL